MSTVQEQLIKHVDEAHAMEHSVGTSCGSSRHTAPTPSGVKQQIGIVAREANDAETVAACEWVA